MTTRTGLFVAAATSVLAFTIYPVYALYNDIAREVRIRTHLEPLAVFCRGKNYYNADADSNGLYESYYVDDNGTRYRMELYGYGTGLRFTPTGTSRFMYGPDGKLNVIEVNPDSTFVARQYQF